MLQFPIANSRLLGIMGRQAAYTGAAVTWELAMGSVEDLNPAPWAWSERKAHGLPVPGKTKFS